MTVDAGRPGRVVALDPGSVRIGVAVCDSERRLAVPRPPIEAGRREVGALRGGRPRGGAPVVVVVGHPLHLDGTDGTAARARPALASALRDALEPDGVEVELHDERLTTVTATARLREAGRDARTSKSDVDGAAAVVLLESWLSPGPRDDRRTPRPGRAASARAGSGAPVAMRTATRRGPEAATARCRRGAGRGVALGAARRRGPARARARRARRRAVVHLRGEPDRRPGCGRGVRGDARRAVQPGGGHARVEGDHRLVARAAARLPRRPGPRRSSPAGTSSRPPRRSRTCAPSCRRGPNANARRRLDGRDVREVAQDLAGVVSPAFAEGSCARSATAPCARRSSPSPDGSLEGLVAPGTYVLVPGEQPATLLAQMAGQFVRTRAAAWGSRRRRPARGLDANQLITVASIVEKEGYLAENMPKVATVIYNRLARGSPLQMDSTVEYAHRPGRRSRHPRDRVDPVARTTRTCTRASPRRPSASPRPRRSTRRCTPPAGPWLYFTLVDNDGTMAFASTFAEQLANERLAAVARRPA